MLLIYYICGVAETNRAPFDLPEAESELVAGYMTEYSGMRWAMFYLGEYGNMLIVSSIATYMFLGGFSGPGVGYLTGLHSLLWGFFGNILALVYFVLKVYIIVTVFVWLRSTLPRLRADQLMQFHHAQSTSSWYPRTIARTRPCPGFALARRRSHACRHSAKRQRRY